jgi:hypothetical protein
MQVAETKQKTDPLEYLGNDVESRQKVAEFLKAVARNSERTGNTYSFALKHFSKFLR